MRRHQQRDQSQGGSQRQLRVGELIRHELADMLTRGEIARRVNLKFAPEIRFHIDERFDEAERIEKLLRTPVVQRDLSGGKDECPRRRTLPPPAWPPPPTPPRKTKREGIRSA